MVDSYYHHIVSDDFCHEDYDIIHELFKNKSAILQNYITKEEAKIESNK
jgi:hypothetical protein